MASGGIEIKVGLDTRQADAQLTAFKGRFKSAIDSNVQAIGALKVATAALGAAGVAAFTAIASRAIEAAKEIDKTRSTLTALTGSTAAANAKLAELRKLAAASPGVTTSFATQLFTQLKAVGTVADATINGVIKSLGKLNAVFGDVGPDFARNLVQIFQQGFERSDIKEALGRVPIFEQLLESAFGTKDPAKLRQLKDAGKLTMDTFFTGISEKIEERFPQVRETLGSAFEKIRDRIDTALAPLGESLAKILLPVFEDLAEAAEKFGKVSSEVFSQNRSDIVGAARSVGDLIGRIGDLGRAIFNLGSNAKSSLGGLRQEFEDLDSILAFLTDVAEGNAISRPRTLALAERQRAERVKAFITRPVEVGGAPSRFGLLGADPNASAARAAAAAAASASGGIGGGGTGRGRRRRSGIEFLPLTADDLVTSQFERVDDFNAVEAAKFRGRISRQQLTAAFEAGERRDRLAQDRLTRAALTEDLDRKEKLAKEAEKARKALEKTGELLSASERFARGFASSVDTIGDAFERFGANVAHAFGNVRDLFNGLKQAVLGFFNDILGSTLQNLVRSTLGPIFGGVGGRGSAAALPLFGFGQGFGIGGGGGTGGIGSILSGGKFNFGALGESLLSSAPILGLGIGSALGGRSIGGNILGAAGGLLTSTFLATTLGAPGALGGLAPALFSNPLTAIAGAGLLVGSVLLGKAKQRKQDEEASGQMLTAALQGIEQLAAAVSSGQITTLAEARSVFENNILAQFISQIRTLKTKSVVESRLTNQVRDLRNVFESRIPPLVSEQEARRNTSAANALNFSRQIPEFATGGVTHGGLAVLHPREMVLNLAQQSAIARMAGPRVFEAAGVPGVQQSRVFDGGGIMPAGSAPGGPIEITILNNVGIGESTCEVIATRGLNTAKGRAVVVKQIKAARLEREL